MADNQHIDYYDHRDWKYETAKDHQFQTRIRLERTIRVDENWVVLHRDGTLDIKKGYKWDGPSGPTVDTKDFLRASLVHDALYQLMRAGVLEQKHRKEADKDLYRRARQDGMPLWRGSYVYLALRYSKAAKEAARIQPEKEDGVLTAP